jgi:hypothetical protein
MCQISLLLRQGWATALRNLGFRLATADGAKELTQMKLQRLFVAHISFDARQPRDHERCLALRFDNQEDRSLSTESNANIDENGRFGITVMAFAKHCADEVDWRSWRLGEPIDAKPVSLDEVDVQPLHDSPQTCIGHIKIGSQQAAHDRYRIRCLTAR